MYYNNNYLHVPIIIMLFYVEQTQKCRFSIKIKHRLSKIKQSLLFSLFSGKVVVVREGVVVHCYRLQTENSEEENCHVVGVKDEGKWTLLDDLGSPIGRNIPRVDIEYGEEGSLN